MRRCKMITINIAKDFSEIPGARFREDGDFSGEEFREDFLKPKFKEAIENHEKLFIDFDGGYGYLISFLEEAFGGLARIYDSKLILDTLIFKSDEEKALIEKVQNYIKNANAVQ